MIAKRPGDDVETDRRNPWLVHGAILVAWVLVAIVARLSMPRHTGHVIPISGHILLGAVTAIMASTVVLVFLRLFGPLSGLKLAIAHTLGVLLGFGGFALMLTSVGMLEIGQARKEASICSNFPVKEWRMRPDPDKADTDVIEVLVRAKGSGSVRLSFVMLYDRSGNFTHSEKYSKDDYPLVPLADGDEAWLKTNLSHAGAAPAWYQFAICTTPGLDTESCGWWGYGDIGVRHGEISKPCPLPPPSPGPAK